MPPIYSKVNPADAPILTLARHVEDACRCRRLQNLVDTRLAQKISQLPGVGLVTLVGRPAARGAHPGQSAGARRLRPVRWRTCALAIAAANVNQAKGSFDGPSARLHHRRQRPAALGRRVHAADHRLQGRRGRSASPDVADAVDDAENVRLAAWANDIAAVIVNIQRQPGANVIEVVDRVKQLLPQLQRRAAGRRSRCALLTDRTITIRASVRDVQIELLLAIALVVMVIFLFLRNARGDRRSPASRCRCRWSAPSASCTSPASASTT